MAHSGLESIDQEVHAISYSLRTQPMTSENKRAHYDRLDVLFDRRNRLVERAMIEG